MDKFFKRAFGWLFNDYGRGLSNPFAAIGNVLKTWFGNAGVLSDMFDTEGIDIFGQDLHNVLGALLNRITAERLTGAEIEANAFSHNEQQIARDWQEYFYNTYQSPMAQVGQMKEAGLNPALMYQSGAGTPSAVGSSAPQSVSPQGSKFGMGELMEMFAGLAIRSKEMNADLDLKEANAYKTRAEGDLIHHNIDAFNERLERERGRFQLDLALTNKKIENIDADIKVAAAQEMGLLQGVKESEARIAVARVDEALKKVDLETRASYNQACLDAVNAKRALDIAETNLKYSMGRKTDKEIEYMKIKVDNLQKEYDKVFAKLDAETKKIGKESGLIDKESQFFEKKFDIQVAGVINGAIQAAKFAPGTRFQGGNWDFSNYLDSMGKSAKSFSKKNSWLFK